MTTTPPLAQPCIVVVDDDPDDLFFFGRALQKAEAGAAMRSFGNAADALAYLQAEGAAAPRMLFLDIKMPGDSGFDLLEWARRQPRLDATPIVMLSGSAASLDMAKANRLGASGYLVKPPEPESLAALLRGEFPPLETK